MAQMPVTPQPFKLFAGDVALDFVNTLDNRFLLDGSVELLASYDDVLRFAQQTRVLNTRQAQKLARAAKTDKAWQYAIDLRETLARIFYCWVNHQPPSSQDLLRLSENCEEASHYRKLSWTHSSFVWHWKDIDGEPKSPIWMLAQHASDLLTSERLATVRSCGDESCRWLFLDTSKNHTRRWCDMKTCGNRMKARRFHARQVTSE